MSENEIQMSEKQSWSSAVWKIEIEIQMSEKWSSRSKKICWTKRRSIYCCEQGSFLYLKFPDHFIWFLVFCETSLSPRSDIFRHFRKATFSDIWHPEHVWARSLIKITGSDLGILRSIPWADTSFPHTFGWIELPTKNPVSYLHRSVERFFHRRRTPEKEGI